MTPQEEKANIELQLTKTSDPIQTLNLKIKLAGVLQKLKDLGEFKGATSITKINGFEYSLQADNAMFAALKAKTDKGLKLSPEEEDLNRPMNTDRLNWEVQKAAEALRSAKGMDKGLAQAVYKKWAELYNIAVQFEAYDVKYTGS